MKIPKLFRTPSHQKFLYRPRFWEPEKEALQERLDQIEQLKNNDPEALKDRISGSFKRTSNAGRSSYMVDRKFRSKQVRQSNMRLVLIVVALLLASYLLLTRNFGAILESVQ